MTSILPFSTIETKGHTYSPAQRMVNRQTRTTLPPPGHLLAPTAISSATITEEIKTKCKASKVQYDKAAGREDNVINIGEFVYARPRPDNQATHGRMAVCPTNTVQGPTPSKRLAVPFEEIRYMSGVQLLLLLNRHQLTRH